MFPDVLYSDRRKNTSRFQKKTIEKSEETVNVFQTEKEKSLRRNRNDEGKGGASTVTVRC